MRKGVHSPWSMVHISHYGLWTMHAFLITTIFLSFPQGTKLHAEEGTPTVTVGSKNFPESYILGEIISKIIKKTSDVQIEKKFGMGGTGLVYQALINGKVDLYPEYTGTISQAILKDPNVKDFDQIQAALNEKGLVMSQPLGFNNTYAFGVRRPLAEKKNLTKISDLKNNPDIRAGFSYEFMDRGDGYKALAKHYGLKLKETKRMEHSLSYEAIDSGKIDLIDVYTTDAKLEKFDLVLLEDDLSFFPQYEAVILARSDFVESYPDTWESLKGLEGKINAMLMTRLNALADLDKKPFDEVAEIFLGSAQWLKLEQRKPLPTDKPESATKDYINKTQHFWLKIWVLTKEHVFLVFVALTGSIIIGLPLGIMSCFSKKLGQTFLVVAGVIQTIPSLALLCFLIPFFGIGTLPALVALFLYGLLPIVRNTQSGLMGLDPNYREIGRALGMSRFQILRLIEMPLASVHILSGIKTSAIISVGTATLAALIGAGGYGTLIVTGLALNNLRLIFQGALPAALLAMLVHWAFEYLDTIFVPKPLQTSRQ